MLVLANPDITTKGTLLKFNAFIVGHMKAICWRKKLNYIYRIIRDKDEKMESEAKKRERRKKCKQERKRQLRIIENRAKDIDYKLKKTNKGEKYFLIWQGIEMGKFWETIHFFHFPKNFGGIVLIDNGSLF